MSATNIIVNDETPRRQYVAAASQTNFDFPFPLFAAGDLQVYLTPAGNVADDTADLLTLTTDYTVTGTDTQDSAVVVLNTGATVGDIITIIRVVDIARTSDYQIAGDLLAETINREQDTEIMIHQQLRADIDRSIRLPITSTVSLDPIPDLEAGQYLRINDTATGFELNAGTNANQAAAVETQTLTSGQTSVVFTSAVSPAAFYLSGPDVDSGRLTLGDDYTVTTATKTVTLTQSYPAGTKLVMVYVDGAADLYSVSAGEVSYAPSGTGAVTTTVESKLRETVSVKDFGAVGDGVTDDTAAIQAAIDAVTLGTVIFPTGTYALTSTLIVPEFTQTKLKGVGSVKLTGDTTSGPLLAYRAGLSGGFRSPTRAIENIDFYGAWTYTAGVTDLNANVYNFKAAEGVLLAIGNDNINVDKCGFYNSPACILYESSNRLVAGRVGHVYGGSLTNYRIQNCMYGIVAYADTSVGGQYAGGVSVSDGYIGLVYKAFFAATGKIVEWTFNNPVFEFTSNLFAAQGHINDIKFGNGHYELGWPQSQIVSTQLPTTFDFRDVFTSTDAKYSAIPSYTNVAGTGYYDNYGYVDNSDNEAGAFYFDLFNRYYTFDQNTLVVAKVQDEFSNNTDNSVIDESTFGDGSYIKVTSYVAGTVKKAGVYNHEVNCSFANDAGIMLRTKHYTNPTKAHFNVSKSPFALGANGSGTAPSNFYNDGVISKVAAEYTVNSAGAIVFDYNTGYSAPSATSYVLYSMAIKITSTSDAADALLKFDGVSVISSEGTLSPDSKWKTFSLMLRGTQATRFWLRNVGTNNVTLRVCDTQAVVFDTLSELNDYVSQGFFATNRNQLDAANDFVQEITPNSDGYTVTTEYAWSASSSVYHLFQSGNGGDMAGPQFEIERMEVSVVSGTPVAIDIGSPTVSNTYYLAAYTPSGSAWSDITLANTVAPNATANGSRIEIRPTASGTVTLRFRTKIRVL